MNLQSLVSTNDMSNVTEKSLVLVVGAGASSEVHFPVGKELTERIAQALDMRFPDRPTESQIIQKQRSNIYRAFQIEARAINRRDSNIQLYREAAQRIHEAMPQAISIDNFIDSHQSNTIIAFCGKLAITLCILAAEASCHLRGDTVSFSLLTSDNVKTWLHTFFQLLTERCQQADLPRRLSKVAIICFNYDRCIEHYLHSVLQTYYGMKPEDAATTLSHLTIYHPYGTVGQLPWQNQAQGIAFGEEPDAYKLLELSRGIRTFTEGVDTANSEIVAIRSALASAERVAFLGFAFHTLNLDLLFSGAPEHDKARERRVYATAHGLSEPNRQAIKRELATSGRFNPGRILLRDDLQCSQLFHEYWWDLSLQ